MKEKKNVIRYAIEAFILIVFFVRIFGPLNFYSYGYDELSMFTDKGEVTENGCSIGEESNYTGIFTYHSAFDLKRGSYRITIEYATDGDENTSYLGPAGPRGYNALRCEEILLSPNRKEMTYHAYLYETVSAHVITYYRDGNLSVKAVSIHQTHDMERMDFVIVLLLITVINVFFCVKHKRVLERCGREKVNAFLIVSGAVVFCSLPLFTEGLMRGADLVFHLLRIEGLSEGLRSGAFPVKIQPVWLEDYGYAVSVFYGDMVLYFAALLRLIGFPLDAAYKVLIFVIHAATAASAYYCLKVMLENRYAAAIGAALYLLCPYRTYGLFEQRLGEIIAYAFVPLVVAGLYNIFTMDIHDRRYKTSFLVPMIGYVGLLNSHVLTTEIVAVFTILVCLVAMKRVLRWQTFMELVKTAGGAFMISAAYIVPFLDYYLGYHFHVNSSQEELLIQECGMDLSQMVRLFPAEKAYAIVEGNLDAWWIENAGVGVLLLLGVFLYLWLINREKKLPAEIKVCFGFGAFAVFLSSIYFPWDYLHVIFARYDLEMVIDSIQRPTRFMQIGVILLIVAGGYGLKRLLEKERYHMPGVIAALLCMMLTLITAGYYADFLTGMKEPETVMDIQKFAHRHTWSRGEYLPEDTDTSYLTAIGVAPGESVEVSSFEKKYLDIRFYAKNMSNEESYVDLPLVYYGGYVAKDSANSAFKVYNGGNNNVVRVDIPGQYEGEVHVYFKEPLLWRLSEAVTLISVLVCIWYYIRRKRVELHGKKC